VSAEEMYSERGANGRRIDDSSTTRPLPLHEITDHPTDLPLIGAPKAARRTMRRPPLRGASGVVYLLLSLLVLVMLGAGGGLYYLDQSYQGKIYPNITVQGLNVGELTQQEAEAALRARYGAFLQHPATLTYGDQSWQPNYADIGISFDFKGAIDSAYRAGRGNGLIENLQEVHAIWENGLELPIHVTFDQNQLRAYVAGVSADLEQAPIDAQLRLDGTTVSTHPAQVGRQVKVTDRGGEAIGLDRLDFDRLRPTGVIGSEGLSPRDAAGTHRAHRAATGLEDHE